MPESREGPSGEIAPQQLVGHAAATPVSVWVVVGAAFDGDGAPDAVVARYVVALAERVDKSRASASEEHTLVTEDNKTRAVRLVASPLARGGVAVALIELDRVREVEAALSRYDMVLRATHDAVWEWNVVTSRAWWNRRMYEMLGYDPATTSPSYEAWAAGIHPEDRPRVLADFDRAVASDALTWSDEFRYVSRDGKVGVTRDRGYIERGAGGTPLRMVGVMSDVTAERAATVALAASEERFRELTNAIDQVFWLIDAKTYKLIYVSPAYETVWGRSSQTLYERTESFLDAIEPEDRARIERLRLMQDLGGYDETYRVRRPDDTVVWVRDRAFPIRDQHGNVVRIAGVATDITTQRRLEEQLSQSQKLESIGRLAGGIAHDFNNLLTVILTAAHFALRGLPSDSATARDLSHVKEAAERAAKLTAQLLAFARRQVIAPARVDLNELTRDTERLLRRVIGEHIELTTVLAPALKPVMADRGQIEQVLVNLAVNARDAMVDGGRLTLETANVTIDRAYAATQANIDPGEYVMLAVSDTGVGIPAENLPHVFEPFFTTKQLGQGTGLGLATCYGIVRQAGGHITVYSEPNHGTTFKILLPAIAVDETVVDRAALSVPPGGSETVLFVEDDPMVRRMGVRILAEQGYRVLEAWGGWEALRLAAEHSGQIHLLVTDVVMPQMSGTELARRLVEQRPELKVLYTSGYTENAIVHHGVLEPRVSFLQKPYVLETLLSKVRDVLDRS